MSSEGGELVLTIDLRKFLVLSVILIFTLVSVGSYIIALFAFDAPSADLPLDVVDIEFTDVNGTSTSTFSRGEQLNISVVVQMALRYATNYYAPNYYYFVSGADYKVIVTVMDPKNKPVIFESANDSLNPDVADVFSLTKDWGGYYKVPNNAAIGTYTVRVMTWSDWLPDGVTRIKTVREGSFEVTS